MHACMNTEGEITKMCVGLIS